MMTRKVAFGVLSTAKIAIDKVIPAMQSSRLCEITAIASRDLEKAQRASRSLGISHAYGSYEELLADRQIDAVYNPLPNHLHVPWSIRALQAGKHVLCEKPIGLTTREAEELIRAGREFPRLKLMEAFMYRHHPQWQEARKLVRDGTIGPLRTIQSFFSYFNDDASNIRNQADIGGGALLDIGCYPVSLSRFLFESEPIEVLATVEYDPQFRVDRLASAILRFDRGVSAFTCGTQIQPYQRVLIFGTKGCVEIEIPFNAPHDRPCRIGLHCGTFTQTIEFPICNQYTIQGDLFAEAILNDLPVPTPIEDALRNMQVIEQILQQGERVHSSPSSSSGRDE